MDVDGGNQILLTDVPGSSGYPKFSSDGQAVVFEWGRDGKRSLASVPLAGGEVTEIESLDSIPINNSYYWAASPDGKYIAHSLWDVAENKMKIAIDATGTGQRITVLNIWPAAIMKWAYDSKSIYYRERQVGYIPEFEVQRVDIATGRVTPLLSTAPELILDLTYSPDGQKLAVVRGRSASNAIMLMPIPAK
jgi:Tol biopolymer transport system component